jgi:hypothetical protein
MVVLAAVLAVATNFTTEVLFCSVGTESVCLSAASEPPCLNLQYNECGHKNLVTAILSSCLFFYYFSCVIHAFVAYLTTLSGVQMNDRMTQCIRNG